MSVQAAYLSIILIWSTTPLAIQWSSLDTGFSFAVLARMTIGVALCLLLLFVLRVPFPRDTRSLQAYVASAAGLLFAMLAIYWGAQHITSGLISVLFGLSPLVTATAAHLWLQEQSLSMPKLGGMLLGVIGLAVIFSGSFVLGPQAWLGILSILFAVVVQSFSLVWIKRIGADAPPLAVTTASQVLALPGFALAWWLTDAPVPHEIATRGLWSIVYLGVIGSVLGFVLYFYIIKHLEAARVALIALITPVTALLLGHFLNSEPVPIAVWGGAALIIGGLALHQIPSS